MCSKPALLVIPGLTMPRLKNDWERAKLQTPTSTVDHQQEEYEPRQRQRITLSQRALCSNPMFALNLWSPLHKWKNVQVGPFKGDSPETSHGPFSCRCSCCSPLTPCFFFRVAKTSQLQPAYCALVKNPEVKNWWHAKQYPHGRPGRLRLAFDFLHRTT